MEVTRERGVRSIPSGIGGRCREYQDDTHLLMRNLLVVDPRFWHSDRNPSWIATTFSKPTNFTLEHVDPDIKSTGVDVSGGAWWDREQL